jgi:UDP-galactose transporter B1
MQTELRFLGFTAGLYVCFIYWGYLQEKLTSTKYQVASPSASGEKELEWNYPFALNFFMALAASTAAAIVETIADSSTTEKKAHIPFITYCRAALSSSLASPIGYAALKYISFPLMVLTKSSKPVPVMFIGVIFYQKRYTWYKVVSVFMLCTGIAMFSSAKKGGHGHGKSSGSDSPVEGEHSETIKLLIGIVLVSLNLLLDGYTNNEQDQIFEKNGATSYQMMKNVNLWQTIYILGYLVVGYVFLQGNSELVKAHNAFTKCPELRYDIMLFCLCASMGQVLIFAVMKEFGSLVWITISITRKLFTILFSVFMFNHPVNSFQWLGIASVFGGMYCILYMQCV